VNGLNGLDGKSVLIGGALVLGGIVATKGGLLPLLLVGGFVYFMGSKKGWWGHRQHQPGSEMVRHRPPGGPPFFAEWHRQAHAADAAYPGPATQPAAAQPAVPTAPVWSPAAEQAAAPTAPAWDPAPAPAAPQAPAWQPEASAPAAPTPTSTASAQPQDVEVRIPVTAAPTAAEDPAAPPPAPEADYRRTVGDSGVPLA